MPGSHCIWTSSFCCRVTSALSQLSGIVPANNFYLLHASTGAKTPALLPTPLPLSPAFALGILAEHSHHQHGNLATCIVGWL